MLHLQKLDQEMSNYIGQIQTVKEELAELLPITANIEAQELQRDKFFMLLTLAGLPSTLASIRDHLASPMVPSMEDVFARCCMFLSPVAALETSPIDSAVLASQVSDQNSHGRSNDHGVSD